MQVAEILQLPVMQHAKLLAGHAGLHREIYHVNMMDAPDITGFLKRDELLVTTGYHMKDKPEKLIELVQNMAAIGCGALGIKLNRFLKQIPEDAAREAESLDFPLIALADDPSLGDITNQVLSAILDKRTTELQHAMNTHKIFTNHIMDGNGVSAVLNSLRVLIEQEVLLTDDSFRLLLGESVEMELPERDALPQVLSGYALFSDLELRKSYSVYPVMSGKKKAGYLVINGVVDPHETVTWVTIEQAANVISFEWMKEESLKQYTRRVKNEFFHNVMEGIYSTEQEVVNRAKEFSLQNDAPYIWAVGKFDQQQRGNLFPDKMEECFSYLEQELTREELPIHVFTRDNAFVLACCLTHLDGKKLLIKLRILQEKMKMRFGLSLSFGLSNRSRSFLQVKEAYREAAEASRTAYRAGKLEFIESYTTKNVVELLRMLPEGELAEFHQQILQPFFSLDKEESESLLYTLYVYMECHCQISETAKRLFVHRNTVVYRLEKCEEVLGKKIKEPETTLGLRIAFRIRDLLHYH